MLKINNIQDLYWVNCFGAVRKGDLIGHMVVNEMLRFQGNKEVKFHISYPELVADFIPEFPEYFFPPPSTPTLVKELKLFGNLWGFYDYIYKYYDIVPKLVYPRVNNEKFKIVINPLFDAPYSVDRNWTPDLFNNLMNHLTDNMPEAEKVIIGGKNLNIKETDTPNVRVCLGSVANSLHEIRTADAYIGGETGMTHFAFVTENQPDYVVCLYGHRVPEHTTILTKNDKAKVTEYIKSKDLEGMMVCTLPRPQRDKSAQFYMMDKGNFTDLNKITEGFKEQRVILPEKYNITIIELGKGNTHELAKYANTKGAVLYSISDFRTRLEKAKELGKLHTSYVKLIAEDEDVFMRIWGERPYDVLYENGVCKKGNIAGVAE
jgi:hypothetical protein